MLVKMQPPRVRRRRPGNIQKDSRNYRAQTFRFEFEVKFWMNETQAIQPVDVVSENRKSARKRIKSAYGKELIQITYLGQSIPNSITTTTA